MTDFIGSLQDVGEQYHLQCVKYYPELSMVISKLNFWTLFCYSTLAGFSVDIVVFSVNKQTTLNLLEVQSVRLHHSAQVSEQCREPRLQ